MKTRIHITLEQELVDKMNDRCKQQGCSRSWLMRRAIRHYLDVPIATWLGTASDGQELAALMERMSQIEKEEADD